MSKYCTISYVSKRQLFTLLNDKCQFAKSLRHRSTQNLFISEIYSSNPLIPLTMGNESSQSRHRNNQKVKPVVHIIPKTKYDLSMSHISNTQTLSPRIYGDPSSLTKSALTPISPSSSIMKSETSIYTSAVYQKTTIIKKQINNNLTGQYLSLPIAETAYIFWAKNVETLSQKDKLELACSIYFTMLSSSKEMKHILRSNVKSESDSIEYLSLKFIDMLSWLIRHLLVNNMDLHATLARLGSGHKSMGINIQHFAPMLLAVHETFAYYFEHKYSIKEKYAIDKLFTVAAEIMMGQDIHKVKMMDNFSKSFNDLAFLKNLNVCLCSDVGREYIYRYFQETFCDELVIYLKLMRRYNACVSDKERFMIARTICKTSITPIAPFTINISHEVRQDTLGHMSYLETQFNALECEEFEVPIDLFEKCHTETMQLIQQNHWKKFVHKITSFRDSSNIY
eukprot:7047_1